MPSLVLWILLVSISLAQACCARLNAPTVRVVKCSPPEVAAVTSLMTYVHKTTGVSRFTTPPNAEGAADWLDRVYLQKLFQEGTFTWIKPLKSRAVSIDDAIRLGSREQCDLILVPEVVFLVESSGAAPAEVQVRVQLIEVGTGRLLVSLLQRAASEPGKDLDLVWNIVEGQPALRYRQLAELLAEQCAKLLASMAGPFPVSEGK